MLLVGTYLCIVDVTVVISLFFFLMIRRPPRSTLDRSSAASDVYKRQAIHIAVALAAGADEFISGEKPTKPMFRVKEIVIPVSYTHLRAHETVLDLVCRLLLEKKKKLANQTHHSDHTQQI